MARIPKDLLKSVDISDEQLLSELNELSPDEREEVEAAAHRIEATSDASDEDALIDALWERHFGPLP